MKTLTDTWNNIHQYLKSRISIKRRKKSYSEFYTLKYPEYSLKDVTLDDFIEQVSFSIKWVYIQWWYFLDLYSIWWRKYCTKSSDYVFLTKDSAIESLWEDPIWSYNKKRIQHYKNLYSYKLEKRNKLWDEMWELENILLNLQKKCQ